jgi:mxaJ protein
LLLAAVLSMTCVIAPSTRAAEALRVCSAQGELPYSSQKLDGYENKLAELIGAELQRPVKHVWWSDPRYFVRDYLETKKCDLIMGVDADDPRLLTTRPYFRSGYAFIYRKNGGLKIKSWDSPDLQKAKVILVVPNTPAEAMLRKIGRYHDMMRNIFGIVNYRSPRNQYVRFDPARIVSEVSSGNADVAVLWAPEAARYVKQSHLPLEMEVPADDAAQSPLHFSTAMGVRKDDKALADVLNRALKKREKNIRSLLQAEGIPLLPLVDAAASTALNESAVTAAVPAK